MASKLFGTNWRRICKESPCRIDQRSPPQCSGIRKSAPGGSTQEETAPKPVTLNELQALGRKVALAGHQDALAKVLAKYGASNLSSVPEESRAAALADLEAAND